MTAHRRMKLTASWPNGTPATKRLSTVLCRSYTANYAAWRRSDYAMTGRAKRCSPPPWCTSFISDLSDAQIPIWQSRSHFFGVAAPGSCAEL